MFKIVYRVVLFFSHDLSRLTGRAVVELEADTEIFCLIHQDHKINPRQRNYHRLILIIFREVSAIFINRFERQAKTLNG